MLGERNQKGTLEKILIDSNTRRFTVKKVYSGEKSKGIYGQSFTERILCLVDPLGHLSKVRN